MHGNHHHHDEGEHDAHNGHSAGVFLRKFWLSLVLTVPVLAYSEHVQDWLGFTPPAFPGSSYIPLALSTVIFLYGGSVFIKGAVHELAKRRPGMMTLISLAIVTAYSYSVAVAVGLPGESFFWELASLITIMLLGHWVEITSIAKAGNALEAISQLLPDTAEVLEGGKVTKVPIENLSVGEEVLVRPGTRIPADGIVIDGSSSVDESVITGESVPVAVSLESRVIAGTVNQEGSLTVRVKEVGEATAIAGIAKLVAAAQSSKSHTQVLADRTAYILTIAAIVAAIVTFVAWFMAEGSAIGLERAVTVLIIACPHALGLAIPLVVAIATSISARNGLLVKDRLALEAARKVDVVLFDKTGTLTEGRHGVADLWAAPGYKDTEILRIAASLEQHSEHLIGKGIVSAAQERGLRLLPVKSFSSIAGLGVKGMVGGSAYHAVSRRYINDKKLQIPNEIAESTRQAARQGKSEVYLVKGGDKVIGALTLADVIRKESKAAIAALRSSGVSVAMVTGDSKEVAAHVAGELGIDKFFAEVRPERKAETVKALQRQGLTVAMVGDGVNDAPALAQADVGLAIGTGTDVAVASADILLVRNDPRDVVEVFRLSRATFRKMVQNLIWGAGYNVLAIPVAAGVLYGWGILLSPAAGAILMSLSTVVVAVNALTLRRQFS